MTIIKKLRLHGFKSFAKLTEVEFGNGFNCVIGANGSGKSCSYETIVTLADGGEVEIGKLVEDKLKKVKEIKKLKDGIYCDGDNTSIISINPVTMKIEEKKISKYIKREGEKLYKIMTRSGRNVKATGSHPVMILNEGRLKSVLIKDLNKNEFISVPRKIITNNSCDFNKEKARLLGYLLGDGYIAKDRIEFVNNDVNILQDFEYIINKIYTNANLKRRYEKNITRFYTRNKEIVQEIRDYFNKESKESITSSTKKIPDVLMKSNNEVISNVLAGLYDTDGSIRKDVNIVELCSKNPLLIYQVQRLLLRFGILSKIKKRTSFVYNTINKIKGDYFYLYIYGSENIKRFYINIPLKCINKSSLLKKRDDMNIKSNPNVDLLPKETNKLIKKAVNLLGIKVKLLREEHPKLVAYVGDRCCPSRDGLKEILSIFDTKLLLLHNSEIDLKRDVFNLIDAMDNLHISGRTAAGSIGLTKHIIRDYWATGRYSPREENLNYFYEFIKDAIKIRLSELKNVMNSLHYLANSDIFWDEVLEIKEVEEEKYVYDLTIDENHNFIGNGIFVHNSNVSDAVSFVLGRLSARSMRAEKSSNLIYNGGKSKDPAKHAEVSIVFDNSKSDFPVKSNEVKITRLVKQNGQSVYKINDETVTRQQILELLNNARIDPDGHNIIFQGDIVKLPELPANDKREIIEEISGISVYEDKKHKALLELDKVESRLKEAEIIMTERGAYLRELKKDKDQALKYRDLHKLIKENKATYLNVQLQQKQKSVDEVNFNIEKETKKINKISQDISKVKQDIKNKKEELRKVNDEIISKGEREQIELNKNIEQIKTELVKNTSRLELLENEIIKLKNRKEQLKINLDNVNKQISEIEKQKKDLEKNKINLEKEKEKAKEIHEDKEGRLIDYIIQKITELNIPGVYGTIESLMQVNPEYRVSIEVVAGSKLNAFVVENDYVAEECINYLRKNKVGTAIFLPLNKIKTRELKPYDKELVRTQGVHGLALNLVKFNDKYKNAFSYIFGDTLITDSMEISRKVGIGRVRMVTLQGDLIETSGAIIGGFRKKFNVNLNDLIRIDGDLKTIINQGKLLSQEKERNLAILREQDKELLDFENEIKLLNENIKKNKSILNEKEKQEKKFYEDFKDLGLKRDKINNLIQNNEITLVKLDENLRYNEHIINKINIERARLVAEKEGLEKEFEDFKNENIKKSTDLDKLLKEIQEAERDLLLFGNVNLRALEIYEQIEKEFNELLEKKEKLKVEKQDVLKMMNEIESKKKDLFMQTFNEINNSFRRIFSSLFSKGQAFLELESPESIFDAGLDIKVKIIGNKYLDIKSLSGGEKTLTALAFIFAIQEYQPASFYLLDEVDAALDKTNSEKLSKLIAEYSKKAQYIIISHNDNLITEAERIYGVSMQDGVSKVISLKL